MTNDVYMMAIEEIAELHDEIDRMKYNYEFVVSVRSEKAGEALNEEICDKIMEAKGMVKMLAYIADLGYDEVLSDVIEYRTN